MSIWVHSKALRIGKDSKQVVFKPKRYVDFGVTFVLSKILSALAAINPW